MLSILKRWRDQGYGNIDGTDLIIRKTEDTADVLSLLGDEARFEANYFVGPAAEVRPSA